MYEKLKFDNTDYISGTVEFRGEKLKYRQYTVCYLLNPDAPAIQRMNIIVREDMADDHSAPIMFIHRDGGVGESQPWSFEMEYEEQHRVWSFKGHTMTGALNAPKEPESVIARILKEGFVLASPGVRGRDTEVNGKFTGRGDIPKTIIDLKAAVRYLRFNKGLVPGDTDKIISEGASSGGGSSALLGASGNALVYNKYLYEAGAAPAPDDIFCAIVDSPIHDFDHIDAAYEWQFGPEFVTGLFANDADSAAISNALRKKYIEYVDSLELKDPETGAKLSVSDGSYTEYMLGKLNDSLNVYLKDMSDEEKNAWLSDEKNNGLAVLKDKTAEITSFSAYINWNAGRWMKYVGCYDGFDSNPSRENEAFGRKTGAPGHFSVCMAEALNTVPGHEEEAAKWLRQAQSRAHGVRLLNPYIFIRGEEQSKIASNWYVRDGGHHETTGAVFLNLCLLLEQGGGIKINWRFCWQQNHTSISLKEFDETLEFLNEII